MVMFTRQRRATSIQTCLSTTRSAATLNFMNNNAMEAMDDTVTSMDTSYSDNSMDTTDSKTNLKAIETEDTTTKENSWEESKTNLKAMGGLVPQPFMSNVRIVLHSSSHIFGVFHQS